MHIYTIKEYGHLSNKRRIIEISHNADFGRYYIFGETRDHKMNTRVDKGSTRTSQTDDSRLHDFKNGQVKGRYLRRKLEILEKKLIDNWINPKTEVSAQVHDASDVSSGFG